MTVQAIVITIFIGIIIQCFSDELKGLTIKIKKHPIESLTLIFVIILLIKQL